MIYADHNNLAYLDSAWISFTGDSGGPLLQPDMINADLSKGVASRDLMFGVTSFGEACQNEGGAGAYVHVGSVRGWIESITKVCKQ